MKFLCSIVNSLKWSINMTSTIKPISYLKIVIFWNVLHLAFVYFPRPFDTVNCLFVFFLNNQIHFILIWNFTKNVYINLLKITKPNCPRTFWTALVGLQSKYVFIFLYLLWCLENTLLYSSYPKNRRVFNVFNLCFLFVRR